MHLVLVLKLALPQFWQDLEKTQCVLAPEPAFPSARVSPGLSPLVTSLSSGGRGPEWTTLSS